jgi:hypothetical protein
MGKGRMRRAEAVLGTEAKGKENRVAVLSSSEGDSAGSAQGRGKPCPILKGARGVAEGTERKDPKMPVACVNGVPREPAHTGMVERVALT